MPGSEKERPEERNIQEGRGAGVFSPDTQVTALEAGSKPLKSTASELERVSAAGSKAQRHEGKGPAKSGMNPQRGTNP
jgi:hypothetical protein